MIRGLDHLSIYIFSLNSFLLLFDISFHFDYDHYSPFFLFLFLRIILLFCFLFFGWTFASSINIWTSIFISFAFYFLISFSSTFLDFVSSCTSSFTPTPSNLQPHSTIKQKQKMNEIKSGGLEWLLGRFGSNGRGSTFGKTSSSPHSYTQYSSLWRWRPSYTWRGSFLFAYFFFSYSSSYRQGQRHGPPPTPRPTGKSHTHTST